MTLDEALEARATAIREGYIDCEAINRICECLPGDDPRHPFHAFYMLGRRLRREFDKRYEDAVMKALK